MFKILAILEMFYFTSIIFQSFFIHQHDRNYIIHWFYFRKFSLFSDGIVIYTTGIADNKTSLTRYKLWIWDGWHCSGTWVHSICTFGAGDLKELIKSEALFANKFRLDLDPVALHCAEKWYYKKVRTGKNGDFNVSYYRNMPWVKYHIHGNNSTSHVLPA